MSKVRDMQDFAYRHLKDYTERCHIIKVYATTDPENFVVVIGSKADAQTIPPIIWRALRNYTVDVIRSATEVKVSINESTFVCYQNGRWIR